MTNVGFLTINLLPATPEQVAAWTFLNSCKRIRARQISIEDLSRNPRLLKAVDVLWWHFDSSLEIPIVLQDKAAIQTLLEFTDQGGGILFSLLAASYVVDLGIETVRPNVCIRSAWSEASWASEYPDMRGFAPFKGHPIFIGLPGGAFTWSPAVGNPYAAAYYENVLPVHGRVVAVEKCYIKLNEDRRIISEYSHGDGRIVTVGAHLYFSSAGDRFKTQREVFVVQCLEYLAPSLRASQPARSKSSAIQRTYWRFGPATVQGLPETSTATRRRVPSLPLTSTDLEIHRDLNGTDGNECFDINGDRLLVLGTERGGIEEVWSHPVRIFRDLRTGFRVEHGDLRWAATLTPEVSIRPESFMRRYTIDEAIINETVIADTLDPSGVMFYRIASPNPVELVVTAIVDLRLMWPLSPQATGGLRYKWDRGLNAAIISDESGEHCSVIGSSLQPAETCLGKYNSVSFVNGSFAGERTERTQVALGLRLLVNPGSRKLAIFFAGSSLGEPDAVSAYRRIAANPGRSLSRRIERFKKLERTSIQIHTPDVPVNDAIRWARWSLDRLFASTPGLGRSLMAGYGLSSSGWNGGHEISGRPGYAWYFGRDSVWACFAILDYGDFKRVRELLEFLGDHQDPTGKILHELTTSGFAHYDAADATPLYLILMGRYVRGSGDRAFARDQFERVLKAVRYCFSTDTDNDHLIENTGAGHGWIEGGHLFPSHSEHYLGACWVQALEASALVAGVAGRSDLRKRWSKESRRVRTTLERKFWNPDTGFYRFALLPDGKYSEEKTVLSTVGMYLGCTPPNRSQQSLAEYSSARFSTDWGVRIVGHDHPSYKPTGYHSGSIWPLFTGWTSLAEFRCNRPLQGYSHLLSNVSLFNQFSGGCVEEVLHGETFIPAGVCSHQAWSESMVLQPIFEGMLGLRSDALSKTLHVKPFLPPGWEDLRIIHIPVGSAFVSLTIKRTAGESVYRFTSKSTRGSGKSRDLVSVVFEPLFPLGTSLLETTVNGKRIGRPSTITRYAQTPTYRLRLDGSATVRIRHRLGVALVIDSPHLIKGQNSEGLRIVDESWKRKTYEVVLEGKEGREYLADIFDPSQSIKRIDGGIALTREESRLLVSIPFPGGVAVGRYVRKSLRLKT